MLGKERDLLVLSYTVQLLFCELHALNTLWTGKSLLLLPTHLYLQAVSLTIAKRQELSITYPWLSHYCHTQVGGLTVYLTGPLPLPTPPSWFSSLFGWLLAPEPPPPPLFSGATLEVQRQQRMDQIERMMIHAYNNRQVRLQLVDI